MLCTFLAHLVSPKGALWWMRSAKLCSVAGASEEAVGPGVKTSSPSDSRTGDTLRTRASMEEALVWADKAMVDRVWMYHLPSPRARHLCCASRLPSRIPQANDITPPGIHHRHHHHNHHGPAWKRLRHCYIWPRNQNPRRDATQHHSPKRLPQLVVHSFSPRALAPDLLVHSPKECRCAGRRRRRDSRCSCCRHANPTRSVPRCRRRRHRMGSAERGSAHLGLALSPAMRNVATAVPSAAGEV